MAPGPVFGLLPWMGHRFLSAPFQETLHNGRGVVELQPSSSRALCVNAVLSLGKAATPGVRCGPGICICMGSPCWGTFYKTSSAAAGSVCVPLHRQKQR